MVEIGEFVRPIYVICNNMGMWDRRGPRLSLVNSRWAVDKHSRVTGVPALVITCNRITNLSSRFCIRLAHVALAMANVRVVDTAEVTLSYRVSDKKLNLLLFIFIHIPAGLWMRSREGKSKDVWNEVNWALWFIAIGKKDNEAAVFVLITMNDNGNVGN